MTAREKKAVEMIRADYPNGTLNLPDNEVLIRFSYDASNYMHVMQWQAQHCASVALNYVMQVNDNGLGQAVELAGTEEATL